MIAVPILCVTTAREGSGNVEFGSQMLWDLGNSPPVIVIGSVDFKGIRYGAKFERIGSVRSG